MFKQLNSFRLAIIMVITDIINVMMQPDFYFKLKFFWTLYAFIRLFVPRLPVLPPLP